MTHTTGFHPLPLTVLGSLPRVVQTQAHATLRDPARSVFTDFAHAPCVTVDHNDTLDATLHTMASAHVHMAFVTDVRDCVIGLITTQDLQGERPLQRAMADHVRMDELTLDQLMTQVHQWQVVDTSFLAHARVGDVVATLQQENLRYLLVVDDVAGTPMLQGVFSARVLENALGQTISADLHSRSFAELEAALVR
jgi:predicted transcriptional regulator